MFSLKKIKILHHVEKISAVNIFGSKAAVQNIGTINFNPVNSVSL